MGFCLFMVRLGLPLPDSCHCDNREAWTSMKLLHADHGVGGGDKERFLAEQPPEVLAALDALIYKDRRLYSAAVSRFMREVREVERSTQAKILCEDRERELLPWINTFEA